MSFIDTKKLASLLVPAVLIGISISGLVFPSPGRSAPPSLTELVENFDGPTPPHLPPGWVSQAVVGTGGTWSSHLGTINPYGGTDQAKSPPNLVYFNAYNLNPGESARLFYQQPLNLTRAIGGALSFAMYHDMETTDDDRLQVQVSTDGGGTWQDLGEPIRRYDKTVGWSRHTVSLGAFAGEPGLLVGLLGISRRGNNIHLDDLAVTITVPLTALLVESFDQQNDLPPGWTKTDVAFHGDWLCRPGTNHPPAQPALSPPNLIYFSSNLVNSGTQTRLVYEPGVDLRTAREGTLRFWMFHDLQYPDSADRLQVQVSTDNGGSWYPLGPEIYRFNGYRGWRPYALSLQDYLGQARVLIGFLGITGLGVGRGNDLHLDDLAVYRDYYHVFFPRLVNGAMEFQEVFLPE